VRIAIILGTRPQIIKSAPVFKAFKKKEIDCSVINTGQHYDYEMNKRFYSELELPEPEVDLEIGPGTPNEQISRIIAGLERHFANSIYDIAIVPGDTNSALAAGIACSKRGIPIAHLEAGCRSFDPRMSEENNRRILDHLSQILLCPTPLCVKNAESEHVLAEVVEDVGDTMYDSLLQRTTLIERSDATRRHDLKRNSYAFMTLHRAETVDNRDALISILNAVGSFDLPVLFSVHPRTRARINQLHPRKHPNLKFIGPIPYLDALKLVKDSRFVVTDSGGLQKEAFWLKRPTLIARESTEWVEIVHAGTAFLVGAERKRIMDGYVRLRSVDEGAFDGGQAIFGDGDAAGRVASVVVKHLSRGRERPSS
jgi:UDP-N-acetylglucosamine 2-epimerase